jgi:hypothetical protein
MAARGGTRTFPGYGRQYTLMRVLVFRLAAAWLLASMGNHTQAGPSGFRALHR